MHPQRSDYDNATLDLDSGLRVSFRDQKVEGSTNKTETLLFLHGKNAHSGSWRKNLPFFQENGWRALAFTLPHTFSEITTSDIRAYSEIANEILNKLRIKKLSAIVGNSMGGWIAMDLGVNYPKLTNRLVLEDSAGVESGIPLSIKQQTMIIWGENDRVIPVSSAAQLNSYIGSSVVYRLKNTGHVPHWEQPEEFNQIVSKFLNE